jgi:hypothetical protein
MFEIGAHAEKKGLIQDEKETKTEQTEILSWP